MLPVSKLKPQQLALLGARRKYQFIYGAFGTCKTSGCLIKIRAHLAKYARFYRNQLIIISAMTMEQLRDTIVAEWKQLVPEREYKYNENTHVIKMLGALYSGAIIRLRYGELTKAEERRLGASCSGVYFTQAETLPQSYNETMESRVRLFGQSPSPNPYLYLFDANPAEPTHWLRRRFIDQESEDYLGESQVDVIATQMTVEQSVYSQAQIDEWTKHWTAYKVARNIRGEWVGREGLVYPKVSTTTVTPADVTHFWIGIDPGDGKHPYGLVWVGQLTSGAFVVIDELKVKLGEELGIEWVGGQIDRISERWGGAQKFVFATIDWSAITWRKELPRYSKLIGQVLEPSGNSKWRLVQQGVDLLEPDFRSGVLKISADCPKTLADTQAYGYAQKGEPDKKSYDPHMLDALRYAWIRITLWHRGDRTGEVI